VDNGPVGRDYLVIMIVKLFGGVRGEIGYN